MRLRILSRVWIPIVAASMLFQIGAANITALHANLSDSETSMGNLFEVGSIDVTVVSPRGGENWELGDDVVYVEWNTYPADQTYLIDIWASSDDGDHWQYKLAEDVPNKDQYTPGTDTTGSYRLLIPGQVKPAYLL